MIAPDGAGGAIIAWQDDRNNGDYDIYAQHVLASGAVDPAWPLDGRALCTALAAQENPRITKDGAGGAIVTWEDYRSGDADIYAQHVLASGAVDPAWPANGRALCTAVAAQYGPTPIDDGAGGAIVTWYDGRGGNADIYAQHVLASGAVDSAWPLNGSAVCTAPGFQEVPAITSDAAGGAIITWQDDRNTVTSALRVAKDFTQDIYAQHVLASGVVDPTWPVSGLAVCTAAHAQFSPIIVSDETSGAIIAWNDYRSGGVFSIYAQHVLPAGNVDPNWPVDGRALTATPYAQWGPAIVPDGAGGAIIGWQDYRNGIDADIYAQHLRPSGSVDSSWPPEGTPLCAAAQDQTEVTMVMDGVGGAIAAWTDLRNGNQDIYAQRLSSSGVVDATWPVEGRAVCTTAGAQELPAIASDNVGGAIVAWQDSRSGNTDIYAGDLPSSRSLGVPGTPASGLRLAPPSPNPARSLATVRVELPRTEPISLSIFDESGRLVCTLFDGLATEQGRSFPWDLRDQARRRVRSGIYFVRLRTPEGMVGRKLVVVE